MTTQEAAAIAAGYFTTATRGEGDDAETFVTLKDDRPDWVLDMVYGAHGGMLPDDWRYACTRAAVEWIAEGNGDEVGEFADSQVDVYTGARLAWLSSNLKRLSYTDQACDDFGTEDLDTAERIGWGQYAEASEVFALVFQALESHREEEADAEYAAEYDLDQAREESQKRFPVDLVARLAWIVQQADDADDEERRATWTALAEEVRGL